MIKSYTCEICGTSYNSENLAKDCEQLHRTQKCVMCKNPIKFIYEFDPFFNGVCTKLQPGYGSDFDGHMTTIMICDDCLKAHKMFGDVEE
jgi:hypothetical protein